MYLDFSVTKRDMCLADRTKVFKIIEVLDLLHFQDLIILPVGVSIVSIKQNCLLAITKNIHPKLDIHCIILLLSLVRLEEAGHLRSVLHIAAELIPSRLVNEVIIKCILGKVYWVIAPHH